MWSTTDHLLGDLWALLVKVNCDPDKTPENLDHPARAEVTAKVQAVDKQKLKLKFLARKKFYPKTEEVT